VEKHREFELSYDTFSWWTRLRSQVTTYFPIQYLFTCSG